MKSENIYKLMIFIFLSSFIFGAYLLENLGIQYVSEGGNPLVKIHITSYVLIFAVLLHTLKRGVIRPLANLKHLKTSWLVSMFCITLVIIYGLYRFGTSGMAYLVDTVVAGLLAIFLLSQLDYDQKNKLLKLLAYLLFMNSIVAIVEFTYGASIIAKSGVSYGHFRSTAFLAHALNNALITAALAPILMRYTRIPLLIYFAVTTLALFAFGGRAATGVFFIGMFIIAAPQMSTFISNGVKISKVRFAIFQALAFFVLIITVLLIILTPIGERILNKLYIDGSAQARFDVFIILEQMSLGEWFFGAAHDLISNISFYIEIHVIENYIIGWIVSFGAIFALLLFLSCYKLPLKLIELNTGAASRVTLFIFLLVSLTNNALTTKTPALLFLISAMYLVASRKNER